MLLIYLDIIVVGGANDHVILHVVTDITCVVAVQLNTCSHNIIFQLQHINLIRVHYLNYYKNYTMIIIIITVS